MALSMVQAVGQLVVAGHLNYGHFNYVLATVNTCSNSVFRKFNNVFVEIHWDF